MGLGEEDKKNKANISMDGGADKHVVSNSPISYLRSFVARSHNKTKELYIHTNNNNIKYRSQPLKNSMKSIYIYIP